MHFKSIKEAGECLSCLWNCFGDQKCDYIKSKAGNMTRETTIMARGWDREIVL